MSPIRRRSLDVAHRTLWSMGRCPFCTAFVDHEWHGWGRPTPTDDLDGLRYRVDRGRSKEMTSILPRFIRIWGSDLFEFDATIFESNHWNTLKWWQKGALQSFFSFPFLVFRSNPKAMCILTTWVCKIEAAHPLPRMGQPQRAHYLRLSFQLWRSFSL